MLKISAATVQRGPGTVNRLLISCTRSVRKVSNIIFYFCENLVDFNEARLYETILPPVNSVS